jgi:hypothetical protein
MADHGRALEFEPLSDVVRCLCDQLLEDLPRDVLAQAELLGENRIAFCPLDHVQKAELRETRAVIGRNCFHNLLVAARDQQVCDRFLERLSFRDRKHMRLAFQIDIGDQGVRFDPLRILEYGSGDFDLVVKRQFVNDIDRGIVDAGQPLRELRAGCDFDLVREPPDDLAKGRDLFVAIAAGYQKISRVP